MKIIDNLDELKKIELDIMIKIHQFCEKNNIKYYMIAGTLIGAIRHKGFIPAPGKSGLAAMTSRV